MLILTSSNCFVTKDFLRHINRDPKDIRVTFISTAAEVETGDLKWLEDDRQTLVDVGFQVSDFTVTNKNKNDVKKMMDVTDFIFVSGGNTFYLLQEIKKSGFDELISEFVKNGGIYGGSSAGSVITGTDISLFKDMDDYTLAPELQNYTGMNLVDVVVFPHWGSKYFKDEYEKLMKNAYKKGLKIILLTDDQYLLVDDNGKYKIESI